MPSHSQFLRSEHVIVFIALLSFKFIEANTIFLQMVKRGVTEYGSQALNVIFALLEDNEDEVANAAVCGLSPVS